MHSRKRPAPDSLLPLRAPKHPRTTLNGYSNGYHFNREEEGILAKWFGLGKEFLDLSYETAAKIIPVRHKIFAEESCRMPQLSQSMTPIPRRSTSHSTARPHTTPHTTPHHSSSNPPHTITPEYDARLLTVGYQATSSSPSPVPESTPRKHQTDRSTTSQGTLPPPSQASSNATTINLPKQDAGERSSGSHMSGDGSTSREPRSKSNSADNLAPKMDKLNLSDFNFKWPEGYASHLQLDEALARTAFQQKPSIAKGRYATRRPHRNREHIYAKVHRANVMARKREEIQRQTRELYETRRRTGFTSGFSDFEGLLAYQFKLEKIVRPEETYRADRPIPEPTDEDDQAKFLQRALDKANATLRAPKPAQPFIPTLEQLQKNLRRKDDEIDRQRRPVLPSSMPPEDESKVKGFMGKRGVVSKFGREQVTDTDLSRLRPGQWLNDEIINFYGAMLLGRSEGCKENPGVKGKKPLNVHYFSTFFWSKLAKEGYEKGRLAKWTKKIDLFSKDVVLIPVNHSNSHWTAAAINFRQKRIESYDSMNVAKGQVFQQLRSYLEAEHQNKRKKPFDFTGWQDWAPENTPQQENGYDCGVFTCQFLEHLSRGEEEFIFAQRDMPYLRRKMIWEIGSGKLRNDY